MHEHHVVSPSWSAQDEPELVVSSLWHTVAVNATTPQEKLQAFQHAIQSLKVRHVTYIHLP